jgi:hypothetical protein
VFEEPELHVIKFPRNPEGEAERDRQQAESLRRYRGQVAMTLIELGLNPGEVAAWSESILDRLFIVLHREGGEPCRCSCHPRLPDSDLHDGFSCSCRLTAEERHRHADERRAHLEVIWDSPEAAARRARRQTEENELASWLAGQPDVVIGSYGGWAPEQWRGSVAGHSFYFRERHDYWRIELDLEPSGRSVQTWRGGDLDDEGSYQPQEIEEGEVIAEGVVDVTGYGTSPVERAAFIVETIRNHLTQTACTLHLIGLVDLERRLGRRPDWCPACGVRLRHPA